MTFSSFLPRAALQKSCEPMTTMGSSLKGSITIIVPSTAHCPTVLPTPVDYAESRKKSSGFRVRSLNSSAPVSPLINATAGLDRRSHDRTQVFIGPKSSSDRSLPVSRNIPGRSRPLRHDRRLRGLAMLTLAVDSKLCGCDRLRRRVADAVGQRCLTWPSGTNTPANGFWLSRREFRLPGDSFNFRGF